MSQEKIIMTLPKAFKNGDGTYGVGYYQNGQYSKIGNGGLTLQEAMNIVEGEHLRLSTVYKITTNAAGVKIIIIGEDEDTLLPIQHQTAPAPDRAAIAAHILAAYVGTHTTQLMGSNLDAATRRAVRAADALIEALKQNKQDDATN